MTNAAMGTALQQIHRLFSDGAVAGLPDQQLLARFVAARDEAAFEALVARHGPMVLGVCRSVLKDEHDAEDAFQATFLVFARKAESLWARDTLGGWLHRVAYRIALHAEAEARIRRVKEAAVVRVERDETWSDWIPVLHDEIDRLPEIHRVPIVLCDLQELTYEQAAQQLHWTVPTLRCRLAKARERLRGRLTRRGLTGAGATLGVMLGTAQAKGAVPLALIQAAIRLAVKGSEAGAISVLAAGMLKTMCLARIKAIAGLMLAVGAAAACVATAALAAGLGQTGDVPPKQSQPGAINPPARAQAAEIHARDQDEDGEVFDYRGRVVGPAGQPVSGAKLFLLTSSNGNEPQPPWATSGPNGRFAFSVPASKFEDPLDPPSRRVTAVAPGFGVGMTDSEEPDAGRELTIRLVEDLPIEGRLVDRDGHPVVGASVRIRSIFSSPNHDLGPWLAATKAQAINVYSFSKYFNILSDFNGMETGAFPEITTDSQGRFRLTGTGRERLVNLEIEAPEIRLTRVAVMTRRCDPIQAMVHPGDGTPPELITYHGASPQLVAFPCRPIEGIVRDQQTGKPIPGAKIRGDGLVDTDPISYMPKYSTSDAHGHYRIHDVPRGRNNMLTVHPPSGEPYLFAFIDLGDSPDHGTIHQDVELVRGTLIEGRITDRSTGRPVSGCSVTYHVASNNPNLDKVSHFRVLPPFGYFFRTAAKEDGTFQIAALPGPGLLTIDTPRSTYPDIDPDEWELPGSFVPELGMSCQAGVVITVAQGVERQRQDIQLAPGVVKEVTCIDPDGKPLEGAFAFGLDNLSGWTEQPNEGSTFYVEGLRKVDEDGLPGQVRSFDNDRITWSPRTLLFLHEKRKLAGWLGVRGNEAGPLRIRMEPWGTAIGRVVDADGNPRANLELGVMVVGKARICDYPIDHRPDTIRTDAEGRFRIEGLAPGLNYQVYAQIQLGQEVNQQIDIAATTPGETRNLGDITIIIHDAAN